MREYRVVLTPRAEATLEAVGAWIAEASGFPKRALDYIRKLRERIGDLRHAPIRGAARDDLRPGLRIWAIDKRCVIAFEVDDGKAVVRVLNFYYGGRDYEALLRLLREQP
jgi:plasmid stabilization system protein ParE